MPFRYISADLCSLELYFSYRTKTSNTIVLSYGIHSPSALVYDSINNVLLVGDKNTDRILLIDCENDSVIGLLNVAPGTNKLFLEYKHNKIYGIHVAGYVSIIDATQYNVLDIIEVEGKPVDGAIGEGKLFVVNNALNKLHVINTYTGEMDTTIETGLLPVGIVYDSIVHKVFVTNQLDDNISVIDAVTYKKSTIFVGDAPGAIVFNPVSKMLYCANELDNTVTIIDDSTLAKVATIVVGSSPKNLVVSEKFNKVYCANYNSNSVSVIASDVNEVIATIGTTYPVSYTHLTLPTKA